MASKQCESCMMPLSQDPGKSGDPRYCSYCCKDGKLVAPNATLKEFQKCSYDSMRQKGMNPIQAWIFTQFIAFAPRWKNKK